MAVSFTTIIVYEVIKIWKALGTRTKKHFSGGEIRENGHLPAPGYRD